MEEEGGRVREDMEGGTVDRWLLRQRGCEPRDAAASRNLKNWGNGWSLQRPEGISPVDTLSPRQIPALPNSKVINTSCVKILGLWSFFQQQQGHGQREP